MELDQSSWNELLAKSNAGDPVAQNDLAMWFENGSDSSHFKIEIDLDQAAHWYLLSAKSGNSDSQDSISRLYSLGHGIEQSIEKSIEWALKAIEQGNAMAAANLGTVYRDELNFEKAFEYYSLAVEMGDKSALLQIGLCYYFGVGITMNHKKANELFQELKTEEFVSESEKDAANYWIGLSYLTGKGQIKSIENAREYLEQANIDEDHESAQLILNIIGRNS